MQLEHVIQAQRDFFHTDETKNIEFRKKQLQNIPLRFIMP